MAVRLLPTARRVLRPVLGPVVRKLRRRAAKPPAPPAAPRPAAPSPAASRPTGPLTLEQVVENQPAAKARLDKLRGRVALLEGSVTELKAELATATAASETVTDDALQYLFIVTYGRSGSTLLQGVLNSTPGVLIRGENRDALNLLHKYHTGLVEDRDRFTRERARLTPANAWYGIDGFREDISLARTRSLVVDSLLRPRPDTRIIGFKEIRWRHEDYEAYLTWMQGVFPGMRVIVNSRDHDKVLKSSWWAKSGEKGPEVLTNAQARIDAIGDHFGDRAFRLHFDDWVQGADRLQGLFEWLGEPFDHDRISTVLNTRHSV